MQEPIKVEAITVMQQPGRYNVRPAVTLELLPGDVDSGDRVGLH